MWGLGQRPWRRPLEEGLGKAGAKDGGPPGGASSPGSLLPQATLVPTHCPHSPLPAGLWSPPFPSSGWTLCIIVQALPAMPPQVTTRFLHGLAKLGTLGTLLLPLLWSPVSRSWATAPFSATVSSGHRCHAIPLLWFFTPLSSVRWAARAGGGEESGWKPRPMLPFLSSFHCSSRPPKSGDTQAQGTWT